MTDLTAERIKDLREKALERIAALPRVNLHRSETEALYEQLALLSMAERSLPDARSLEGVETFTRFELIDHTGAEPRGRVFVRYADLVIEQAIQDDGRTLKIFLRSAS